MEQLYVTNMEKAEKIRQKYKEWKKASLSEGGYFPIFNGFKDGFTLQKISGGALRCYMYLGLNSSNDYGESWHSIETIAKYFKKDVRTVGKWIRELRDLKLIDRFQLRINAEAHTFLLPYKHQTRSDLRK